MAGDHSVSYIYARPPDIEPISVEGPAILAWAGAVLAHADADNRFIRRREFTTPAEPHPSKSSPDLGTWPKRASSLITLIYVRGTRLIKSRSEYGPHHSLLDAVAPAEAELVAGRGIKIDG